MAEYIERAPLLEWTREFYPEEKVFASAVINAPAADVQEVRHGKWKKQNYRRVSRIEAVCSECGREAIYKVVDGRWQFEDFCPRCGAKMDKE